MLGHYAKIVLTVGIASFLYLALATFLVGYSFGIVPGLEVMEAIFGRPAGSRLWAHSVHALALVVSGIPSAAILGLALRSHPVAYAALTGVIAAVAALADTLLRADVLAYLDSTDYLSMGIDGTKTVMILVLLTWLLGKLPSNNAMQRSARVVTPLAGTASGSSQVRSASGAPTARRR